MEETACFSTRAEEAHLEASSLLDARRGIIARCRYFDGRVHVYDAAARPFVLPRIIELAEDRREAKVLQLLLRRMLAPDPDDRPTYSELLQILGEKEGCGTKCGDKG
mmetsp:Transcript_15947/g.47571  ORF Transcript_15947/g.47571 Transcript_15947/m.47571 type:complete len:107 (+) Transcript_15947:438-758(+)